MKDFRATVGGGGRGSTRGSLLNQITVDAGECDSDRTGHVSKLNGLWCEIASSDQIPLRPKLGEIGLCRRGRTGRRLGCVRAEQVRIERWGADDPTLQRQGNRIGQHG